jgi:hypothetical protein
MTATNRASLVVNDRGPGVGGLPVGELDAVEPGDVLQCRGDGVGSRLRGPFQDAGDYESGGG